MSDIDDSILFAQAIENLNRRIQARNQGLSVENQEPQILTGLEAEISVGIQHEFAAFILLQTQALASALSFRAGSPPMYDAIRSPKTGFVLSKSSNHGIGKSLIPAVKLFTRLNEYRRPMGYDEKDEERLQKDKKTRVDRHLLQQPFSLKEHKQPIIQLKHSLIDVLEMTQKAPLGDLRIDHFDPNTMEIRLKYQENCGPLGFDGVFVLNINQATAPKEARLYTRPWKKPRGSPEELIKQYTQTSGFDLSRLTNFLDYEVPIFYKEHEQDPGLLPFNVFSDKEGNPIVGDWDLFTASHPKDSPDYATTVYDTFDRNKAQQKELLKTDAEFLFLGYKQRALNRLKKAKVFAQAQAQAQAQAKAKAETQVNTRPKTKQEIIQPSSILADRTAIENRQMNRQASKKRIKKPKQARNSLFNGTFPKLSAGNQTVTVFTPSQLEPVHQSLKHEEETFKDLFAFLSAKRELSIITSQIEAFDKKQKAEKDSAVMEVEVKTHDELQDKQAMDDMRQRAQALEKTLKSWGSTVDEDLKLFNRLDPVDRLFLLTEKFEDIYSLDALERAGRISPFEFLQICLLNSAYADPYSVYGAQREFGKKNPLYDAYIKCLLQHGPENRNPYAPSNLNSKILHFYRGAIYLTHTEEQLVNFYMSGNFLRDNVIDIHPGWNMSKWAPVLQVQAKLGQVNLADPELNRPDMVATIRCYQDFLAVQTMEKSRAKSPRFFSLNEREAKCIIRQIKNYQTVPAPLVKMLVEFLMTPRRLQALTPDLQFPGKLKDYHFPIQYFGRLLEVIDAQKIKNHKFKSPGFPKGTEESFRIYKLLLTHANDVKLEKPVIDLIEKQIEFGQAASIPKSLMERFEQNAGKKFKSGSMITQFNLMEVKRKVEPVQGKASFKPLNGSKPKPGSKT